MAGFMRYRAFLFFDLARDFGAAISFLVFTRFVGRAGGGWDGRSRYSVERDTPSVRQMSATLPLRSAMSAAASAACFLSRRRGLPPVRPLALALDSPAFVRSRMTSRSNSANAHRTDGKPACRPAWSCRSARASCESPGACLRQVADGFNQMSE